MHLGLHLMMANPCPVLWLWCPQGCSLMSLCMVQVTVLYPSFIFNARRKYDKSRRGDPSCASTFVEEKVDADMPFRAGDHSFDDIPRQKSISAM